MGDYILCGRQLCTAAEQAVPYSKVLLKDDHKTHGLTHDLGRSLCRHQREVCHRAQIQSLCSESAALRRLQELRLKTCSTAMACSAEAASPSEAYALLARWAVVLHDSREGWCLSLGSRLLQDTGAQWRSPWREEGARARVPPPHTRGKRWPVRQSGRAPIGAQTTFSPAARIRWGRTGLMPSNQLSVWTWNTRSRAYSWQALLEGSR